MGLAKFEHKTILSIENSNYKSIIIIALPYIKEIGELCLTAISSSKISYRQSIILLVCELKSWWIQTQIKLSSRVLQRD